ncbi:MAG: phosphate signaling complex protein PhoU [Pseudomonadota bacterium]
MSGTDHTVTAFDTELRDLTVCVVQMGGLTEHLFVDAISALRRSDPTEAVAIIERDERVDALEAETSATAVALIARRQPVARDLREIVGALKTATDLERVGDLAKNIAKRVLVIHQEAVPPRLMGGIEHLSEIALLQLKNVLDAYARRDADAARRVWSGDETLDATYTSIFRELLTYMMEDPRNITACTHLLFAAKNIERIGDHSTNIAETVHYMVTGSTITEPRPKGDTSSTRQQGNVTIIRGVSDLPSLPGDAS